MLTPSIPNLRLTMPNNKDNSETAPVRIPEKPRPLNLSSSTQDEFVRSENGNDEFNPDDIWKTAQAKSRSTYENLLNMGFFRGIVSSENTNSPADSSSLNNETAVNNNVISSRHSLNAGAALGGSTVNNPFRTNAQLENTASNADTNADLSTDERLRQMFAQHNIKPENVYIPQPAVIQRTPEIEQTETRNPAAFNFPGYNERAGRRIADTAVKTANYYKNHPVRDKRGKIVRGDGKHCLGGVKDVLNKLFGQTIPYGSAYEANKVLPTNNGAGRFFTESVNFMKNYGSQQLKYLPAGSIVVWNPKKGHPHGHISIADGAGREMSDIPRQQITQYGSNFRVYYPNQDA